MYDLIVVGSGIMGTFHAYHALLRKKKVLLIEKDYRPQQATVRNFGQVVPSGMKGRWFEYGRRGLEFYKTIQSEFDVSIRNNGSVYIASDAEEQNLLHEVKNLFDNKNYASQFLSASQVLEKYPVIRKEYAREALFFPEEVSAEPNLLIYRLHTYLQNKFSDFTFLPASPVIDCGIKSEFAFVKTSSGKVYEAEKVIICSGGEFQLLFPEIFAKSGIVTSKLQMLRTISLPELPLEGNILTGLTIRRYESFQDCPSYAALSTPAHLQELKKWGIHILFKKAIDGTVIVGDSHEYAKVGQTEDLGYQNNEYINELMLAEAERIVNFPVRQISERWAGYYPQHENDIFEYDIENRIHIRTAIGGKGMTASCGYAEEQIESIIN
jgi:FAD dependent oxidoreductase TIGR03364